MPRPKPWISKIPHILKQLRESDQPSYTRLEVQALFEISSSPALELMHVVGCRLDRGRADGALVTTREKLIDYLTFGPEAQAAATEAARRAKLATKLNAAAKDQKLRHIELMDRDQVRDWLLRDLANVSIENGVCTVVFSNAVDLMTQLYKLVQAAGVEWDAFEKMCELRAPAGAPAADISLHSGTRVGGSSVITSSWNET
jgi:hypothetical protein